MAANAISLQGKVALITGASGGIGSATAELFAQAGAKIFLSGTKEEKLVQAAKELSNAGAKTSHLALDITAPDAPQTLIKACKDALGPIDILVNSAGINRPQRPEEVTIQNWDDVLNINLRALFFVSQAAGREMIQRRSGTIINVSSQAGLVALPLRAAYCSSKGAVNQLTRTLALEWAPYNVTVNAVAPTFVETPLVAEMFKEESFRQYVTDSIPLGRMPSTADVARAILFLASDWAGNITGHILSIDGGWTIK